MELPLQGFQEQTQFHPPLGELPWGKEHGAETGKHTSEHCAKIGAHLKERETGSRKEVKFQVAL